MDSHYFEKYGAEEEWEIDLVEVSSQNPLLGKKEIVIAKWYLTRIAEWAKSHEELKNPLPDCYAIVTSFISEDRITQKIFDYIKDEAEVRNIKLPNSFNFILD